MITNLKQSLIVVISTGLLLVACAAQDAVMPNTGVVISSEDRTGQELISGSDQVVTQGIEITNEAILNAVDLALSQDTPVQVSVAIQGTLPDSCLSVDKVNLALNGTSFALAVATKRQTGMVCKVAPQLFQETVTLPIAGLPAGTYAVSVSGSNMIDSSFTLTDDMVQPLAIHTPEQPGTTIEGIVWNDDCQTGNDSVSAACESREVSSLQGNGIFESGENGIAEVEVTLLVGQCPGSETLALAKTDEMGRYHLTGLQPGLYCVTVNTTTPANAAIFGSGGWTYPGLNIGSTTVSLVEDNYQSVDFGWSFQPVKLSASQPFASDLEEQDQNCRNSAAFIADVTIPDDMILVQGANFEKTWRVLNQGDCVWGPAYRLVFAGGELMDGPIEIALSQAVEPGQEVDLSVPLVAPREAGKYRGDWELQGPNGETFGSRGDYPLYVQIIVENNESAMPLQLDTVGGGATGIQGIVWQDHCGVLSNGSPSSGCVLGSNGAYQANGSFDSDEKLLAGIVINLSRGNCTGGQKLASTSTGSDGSYLFADIESGTYCITALPPAQSDNSILVAGRWTYPALGVGHMTMDVEAGNISTANFGWNYWLQ